MLAWGRDHFKIQICVSRRQNKKIFYFEAAASHKWLAEQNNTNMLVWQWKQCCNFYNISSQDVCHSHILHNYIISVKSNQVDFEFLSFGYGYALVIGYASYTLYHFSFIILGRFWEFWLWIDKLNWFWPKKGVKSQEGTLGVIWE